MISEDKLVELRCSNEDLWRFERLGGTVEILFRRCTSGEFSAFSARVQKNDAAAAFENLVRACAVYPSREEVARILAKFPAITADLAGEILKASSAQETEEAKKA